MGERCRLLSCGKTHEMYVLTVLLPFRSDLFVRDTHFARSSNVYLFWKMAFIRTYFWVLMREARKINEALSPSPCRCEPEETNAFVKLSNEIFVKGSI